MILKSDETILFWGHTYGTYKFLSNFYPFYFDHYSPNFGDVEVHSSEQAFMLAKAETFNDLETAKQILDCDSPEDAKALGRQVKGFDNNIWSVTRQSAMMTALMGKFCDTDLTTAFLQTGTKHLVESSPYDKIWGIGLHADHLGIYDTDNWKGLNELGNCLMALRFSITGQK